MTYYDPFDCKIQCDEVSPVSAEEQEEVLRLLAEDKGSGQPPDFYLDALEPTERAAVLEQLAFEQEQAPRKVGNWNRRDDREIRIGGMSI
jgi:hypothetical protein